MPLDSHSLDWLRKEARIMCSPSCLEALYGPASRRGFVQKSIMAAAAVACGARAASGGGTGGPSRVLALV
jgi:hypothetical protein